MRKVFGKAMMTRKGMLWMAAVMVTAAALFTGCSGGAKQETTAAAAQTEAAKETKAEEKTQAEAVKETAAEETTQAEAVKEAAEAEMTAPAKAGLPVPAEAAVTDRQAFEIALKHAGVQEKDTSRQEIELDYENGKQVYEVGFHVGKMEYDYDIDASTGDVLKYEIEQDD